MKDGRLSAETDSARTRNVGACPRDGGFSLRHVLSPEQRVWRALSGVSEAVLCSEAERGCLKRRRCELRLPLPERSRG